jgi:pimeloyl-ACP methyl ester carboxylesterase
MRKPLWLLVVVAALPIAGVMYQKLGAWSDRRRHMRRGRTVRVRSGLMYVCEMGSAASSSPAVVFESGIGATSQNWFGLQQAIAQDTRTVSYDRAGLGWSSAAAYDPTPRNLARELNELLTAAGISRPYVVVGHSFGGLLARQFAADYPRLVTGLVLVDPMRPEDWPSLNGSSAALERGIRLAQLGLLAARFGVTRLFMRSTLLGSRRVARFLCRVGGEPAQTLMDRMLCEVGKMPREVWPSVVANWSRPEFFQSLQAYLRSVPTAVMMMRSAPPLDQPVTVLTPISASPLSESQLHAISSNAKQVIASTSAHWIHLDEPELVLAAIRDMLARAGSARSHPASTGEPHTGASVS